MAFIAVLLLDLLQFRLNDRENIRVARQNILEVCDFAFEFLVFVVDFLLLQTGQTAQTHIDDRLCLRLVEVELKVLRAVHDAEQRDLVNPERLSHQVDLGFGFVFGSADDGNDAVNVIGCHLETFQNMRTVLRFFQVKARAALDDILLEADILVDDLPQREHTRLQFARCA